jgi:hypothetical protein
LGAEGDEVAADFLDGGDEGRVGDAEADAVVSLAATGGHSVHPAAMLDGRGNRRERLIDPFPNAECYLIFCLNWAHASVVVVLPLRSMLLQSSCFCCETGFIVSSFRYARGFTKTVATALCVGRC